jgi:hypothetical protein
MKHQTEIYEGEPLNFEMVYRRYLKFSSQNSTVQNVERPVVLKGFEHLKVRTYHGDILTDFDILQRPSVSLLLTLLVWVSCLPGT